MQQMGVPEPAWRAALNEDLKNSPIPSLPPNAGTMSEADRQYFLQVEEISNVLASALKQFSDTGRRMLKMRLTDGSQTVTAVEQEQISSLNVSTPPGSKVVISGPFKISCGFWLLEPQHVRLIGGKVSHMLRSWEIHRDVVIQGKRLVRADDRPAWVPFGEPLKFDQTALRFRAMEIVNRGLADEEEEEEEEDEKAKEFALHREQVLLAARGDATNDKSSILNIGPLNRRAPQLLQITQAFMTADEPPPMKKFAPLLPRDARDFVDKSDPGVEPSFSRGFRGRGRGGRGRRGGRRGRGSRGEDGFEDYGNAPPQRTANLMDFVTHQLGGLSTR